MAIASKGQLIEYCLRALGSPVINIEIDEDQISDRIDDVLQKFIQRHYDGVTEVLYKHTITKLDLAKGYITLPSDISSIIEMLDMSSNTSLEVLDNLEYHMMWDIVLAKGGFYTITDYYINMRHLSMVDSFMSKKHAFFYNTITNILYPKHQLSYSASDNLFLDSNDLSTTNWTGNNASLTGNDKEIPDGTLVAHTATSDAAGVFGFSQTYVTDSYVHGTYTAEIKLLAGTYTGDITVTAKDRNGTEVASQTFTPYADKWREFNFTFTFGVDNINDITIEVTTATAAAGAGETFFVWSPKLYRNYFIVVHGYQNLDPEQVEAVYNNEWIKRYSTALIKKQWGQNIKKYQGVQLPGGVEMNGQQIFDEAVEELQKLDEEFSNTYELPFGVFWG